ncbi:MAG TPA: hypothetical protein VM307_10680, partial [Egibacteraceae bacterium]|nr:hypothetical protein [Egibacteraceae bacterium]
MGDVDGGGAVLLLHPGDLGAHLHAQLRVEVRQGLVEQEGVRVAHDRAPHRDALALPTGQVRRLPVQVLELTENLDRKPANLSGG